MPVRNISVLFDENGNVRSVSSLPAVDSGNGYVDVSTELSDADLIAKCVRIGDVLCIRPDEITHLHVYRDGNWVIDRERQIIEEIQYLESTATPRRFREAIFDNTWMLNLNSQIIALREELNAIRNANI